MVKISLLDEVFLCYILMIFSSSLRVRSPNMQLRELEVEDCDSKMERSIDIHIQQMIRYCRTSYFLKFLI